MTKQELGYWGEQSAIVSLHMLYVPVLSERWRYKRLEIDIIAGTPQNLRFIEVKTRTHNAYLPLSDWFSERKSTFLREAAMRYMSIHAQYAQAALHFDLILVNYNGITFTSTYYPDML